MSAEKKIHCAVRAKPNGNGNPILVPDGNKITYETDNDPKECQFGMFLAIYSIVQIIEIH